MNRSRVVILVLAALAAGAAALLARGLLGGGTPKSAAQTAPSLATTEVLVAASDIEPGIPVTGDLVRWQAWPKSSVDSTFITSDTNANASQVVTGTVARAPIVSGEPLTNTKIVHADSAGFMSARLTPGMRAVSIPISTESGAGGFILPNDRVDVIVTIQVSETPKGFVARTLLRDVRVLAVDQTFAQDKDQKTVIAKTATLELSPQQSEMVSAASSTGVVSLALRALGDNSTDVAMNTNKYNNGVVSVIRYGVVHGGAPGKGE
jgi:pilus assembly protein CpaB